MIVNSKELLIEAKKKKKCIFQFNINNLEWTRFILEECEYLEEPVILGISESTVEYMGGYKTISNLIKNLCIYLNITIPVVIHLDHGKTFDSCKKAIDNVFTSVMIDASKYNIDENINITKKVCDYAHKKNVTVECEMGYIKTEEEDVELTKVADAIRLIKETNADALAPSVGNAHGIYRNKANLDYNRISQISHEVNIPLVLHGGSGLSNEQIKQAIDCGICKLNINTELQQAWASGVRKYLLENDEYDPRKIIKSGESNIKKVIENKFK